MGKKIKKINEAKNVSLKQKREAKKIKLRTDRGDKKRERRNKKDCGTNGEGKIQKKTIGRVN